MILYRIAMLLAFPSLLIAEWRRGGLAERLALRPLPQGAVWLHGASNGELTSARALIAALAARGDRVLVTCNNPTARAMVNGWAMPGVTARMAPFDLWFVVRRFLRCSPRALVIVENELWPERILQARCPVIMVGARMSERSASRWEKMALTRRLLGRMAWVGPQDAGSAERLVALGLPADRLGPVMTLKSEVARDDRPLPPCPHPRAYTLLAASTHEGEDAAILDAFAAQTRFRWLILAPRHPARGAAVAELARARGFTVARRAAGEPPSAQVYVADTLGDMGLWYRAAAATVVCGSFVAKGGHTPFEPAAYGSAILHGPHVGNFTAIYARLDAEGGALATDAAALAQDLDNADIAALATAAARTLTRDDAVAPVLAVIPTPPEAAHSPAGRTKTR